MRRRRGGQGGTRKIRSQRSEVPLRRETPSRPRDAPDLREPAQEERARQREQEPEREQSDRLRDADLMENDADLASVRQLPQFQTMLARVGSEATRRRRCGVRDWKSERQQ